MDGDDKLMVMSDEQCEKLFNSIIDTNKKMVGLKSDIQWLKHNAETQIKWCRKNEDRLIELEAWMGRSKGHFKVLGRALAVIAAVIITVATILYQRLGRHDKIEMALITGSTVN